jgi:hypothetical protein
MGLIKDRSACSIFEIKPLFRIASLPGRTGSFHFPALEMFAVAEAGTGCRAAGIFKASRGRRIFVISHHVLP